MAEVALPVGLVAARRTPLFDHASLPAPLARSHRTTVWATLHVASGSVRYADLEGADRRDERLEAGDSVVIPPDVEHQVEPSTDATFFVQFHRSPADPLVPRQPAEAPHALYRDAAWEHRGRDLDASEEIVEMVTRQYADVVQDDLLAPHFSDVVDWQALIGAVADRWDHVLLGAPSAEPGPDGPHHELHGPTSFTPQASERWLQIFDDTVDGGWSGPNADAAKVRHRDR